MPTRSPTEIVLKNAPPDAHPVGVAAITWEKRASFGPYLRGLRDAARFSLRAASEASGRLIHSPTRSQGRPPSLYAVRILPITSVTSGHLGGLFGRLCATILMVDGLQRALLFFPPTQTANFE